MDPRAERIFKAADFVKKRLDGKVPVAGIVLGSGLGKLADKIENPIVIHYKDIPGFPVSTAIGHKGNFIAGELGGKFVIGNIAYPRNESIGYQLLVCFQCGRGNQFRFPCRRPYDHQGPHQHAA